MKIYGFYHIACMTRWKPIFDEQVGELSKIDFADKIFISVIYTDDSELDYIKSRLKSNWEIVLLSNDFKDYEFNILRYMRNLAMDEDFLCFYLHTKGASICEATKSEYPIVKDVEYLQKCVDSWRRYMSYFLFNNVNKIIELLNSYDAVGVALTEKPTRHFSGNFWWSKSKYIKTLKDDFKRRWTAEFWIGKYSTGNLKNLCNIRSSYTKIIDESSYTSNN